MSDDIKPAIYRLGTRLFRILQLMVALILILGLIYGWEWVSDPLKFPIRSVKIDAPYQHVDQPSLKAVISPYLNQGFIRFRPYLLEEALLKFPWIADIHIERIWPDIVVIHITEQQAVARWGKTDVLNDKGQTFTPPINTIPVELPLFDAPTDQIDALWKNFQTISDLLKPLGFTITQFTMDNRLSLKMVLNNGTTILLGKTDPLLRLQRFVKVYPYIFTSNKMQADYIDLRYENGAAINWRNTNQPLTPTNH